MWRIQTSIHIPKPFGGFKKMAMLNHIKDDYIIYPIILLGRVGTAIFVHYFSFDWFRYRNPPDLVGNKYLPNKTNPLKR